MVVTDRFHCISFGTIVLLLHAIAGKEVFICQEINLRDSALFVAEYRSCIQMEFVIYVPVSLSYDICIYMYDINVFYMTIIFC